MVYLSLGTNLGDREANLQQAITLLNAGHIIVVKQSAVYETAPRDVLDQPCFLNMVLACETTYSPADLMQHILRTEMQMGRDRSSAAVHRGPRLIDVDILLYADAVVESPQLTVPHPRMLERRFVLEPLLEIAPGLEDPRTRQPIAQTLARVQDQQIRKL